MSSASVTDPVVSEAEERVPLTGNSPSQKERVAAARAGEAGVEEPHLQGGHPDETDRDEADADEHGIQLRKEFRKVVEDVIRPIGSPSLSWKLSVLVTGCGAIMGGLCWADQMWFGMGVTGLMHPMMWAVYITNFVWWIACAHSGTFISAILYLFRAPFRATFSRLSEAMTIFAIATAGLFPLLHLGRTWRFYWVFPYPNERWIWPNFRSSLILDVFAIGTYLTVSILFFWLGLVPDLAICRDRLQGLRRTVYGWFSFGWDGSHRQWKHYEMAYAILACFAAPLVLSVHSCVSWDFALGIVPGWHSTMFAPYFVDGAIFQGLATVLVLAVPMRYILKLEEHITPERLDQIAKLTLLTGLGLTWSYCSEYFMDWYKHDPSEIANLSHKMFGSFSLMFWLFTFFNCVVPCVFFWKQARRNMIVLWLAGFLIIIGMWFERFVLIAGSLARDYEPYSWAPGSYHFSAIEIGITVGSVCWFLFWFLLFAKFLPVIPMSDTKRDLTKEWRDRQAKKRASGRLRPGMLPGMKLGREVQPRELKHAVEEADRVRKEEAETMHATAAAHP